MPTGSGWMDVEAKCPFYKTAKDKEHVLRCEGFLPGSVSELRFRSPKRKAQTFWRYCTKEEPHSCPIYRMIVEEKYKDKD